LVMPPIPNVLQPESSTNKPSSRDFIPARLCLLVFVGLLLIIVVFRF
jgi:hypothetical protein